MRRTIQRAKCSKASLSIPSSRGVPTIGAASAGNTQASVTFSAPGSTGGASITSYIVTANPSGATGSGASSPIVVTGLTNGTAYTFTVTATNSAGTGSVSAPTNSVTPMPACLHRSSTTLVAHRIASRS